MNSATFISSKCEPAASFISVLIDAAKSCVTSSPARSQESSDLRDQSINAASAASNARPATGKEPRPALAIMRAIVR